LIELHDRVFPIGIAAQLHLPTNFWAQAIDEEETNETSPNSFI
jgi:hypothetical protein